MNVIVHQSSHATWSA